MCNEIYVDNAATTPIDKEALDEMIKFLGKEYANPSQIYSLSKKSREVLNYSRSVIASCIGASREEIIFTSGGTESDNWIIKNALALFPNGKIITSTIEHHAILNACSYMSKFGYKVEYIPVDRRGYVNLNVLRDVISPDCLVSVMFANNEIGTIQPIKKIVEIVKSYGGTVHTDAVQAVGHVPIDVRALGVDFLSASGHKFNGPRGVGFLYKREGACIEPLIVGGGQEFCLRAGTENVASIFAMAIALKNNIEDLTKNQAKIKFLEELFLERLKAKNLPYIINGGEEKLPGIISVSFKNVSGEAMFHLLDMKKIYLSTGSACNGVNDQISHVIKALDVPDDFSKGTLRISLGKQNTEDEVCRIADVLDEIYNKIC